LRTLRLSSLHSRDESEFARAGVASIRGAASG
jgi:hypothetical protein